MVRWSGLPGRAALAVGVLLAGTLSACGSPESSGDQKPSPPVYPYLEVASESLQDVARMRADAGVAGLTLAFVVSGPGCRPVWSRGGKDAADPAVRTEIETLRSAGSPLRISFGGAGGTDLALACADAGALAAAIRTVVDAYRPDGIDLDVEGRNLADPAANARRVAAVRQVQREAAREGREVPVSYTLPAGPDGVPPEGVKLLTDSVAAGITVSAINVMVMNYNRGITDMGDEAVRQGGLAHDLVQRLWPDLSEQEAWQRVALTPMVGRNDVPGEVFSPGDARQLAEFAADRGIGWLSYWSLERDRPCPATSPTSTPTWNCSGVRQTPYQYASILSGRS